ncbi:TlpA family protein disulfide reductase [bacterium]
MKKRVCFFVVLFSLIILFGLFFGCKKVEVKSETSTQLAQEMIATEKVAAVAESTAAIGSKEWGDAPDFNLKSMNGEMFTLSSLKGKVIILDFWATWCPPCRKEIPGFVELQAQYKDQGLEIVGVSLDDRGWDVVKPFASEYNINYVLVVGDKDIAIKYGGITGIPTTFIIDRDGNIQKKHIGYVSKEVFEQEIKELL